MKVAFAGLCVCAGLALVACGGGAPPPPVGAGPAKPGAEVQVGAKSAPPARSTAYTVNSRERVDGDGRKRLRAKVVTAEGLDNDKSIEAIRASIQELLPADGEVEAVEVLVYKTAAETSGNWTLGHGFASKDGKGWTGNGTFGQGVFDRNNIELDMKLPSGEEHFSLAR
jgi:hypothetical protein